MNYRTVTLRYTVILQVRLYAMYDGSKKVLLIAGIPFFVVSATAAAELTFYAIGAQGIVSRHLLVKYDIVKSKRRA